MKHFVNFLICALFFSVSLLFAQQKDTVDVNGVYTGGDEGDLNAAVETAIGNGTLSNTVFRLTQYDVYPVTGAIEVPAGETLELYASPPGFTKQTGPPQICWTASGSVTKEFLIQVYGDLVMKNIWVRYADVANVQTGTPIVFEGDEAGAVVNHGTFENCVFEWMPCPAVTASGSICVRSKHFNGRFINCYFRNCVDRHYMYYGRAVSFPFDVPGYHTDSCYFENCTFANMGYVYMQERTNYSDNVYFNHCTFANVVQFPFESGWWWWLNVNNCLFVNPWMMGFVPANGEGTATVGINAVGDTANFNFEVPFTDQDRHILFTHSAYYMDKWLVDWMRGGWELPNKNDPDPIKRWQPPSSIMTLGNPYSIDQYTQRLFDLIPYPRPMLDSTTLVYFDSTDSQGNKLYPLINRANLYDISLYADSSEEARNSLNPDFIVPATYHDSLEYFVWQKWSDNLNKMWAFLPDSGWTQAWPLPENLAYTNETLKAAAMGGFPLGDLYHWWNPDIRDGAEDYYSAWLAQADDEHDRINTWLETGTDPYSGITEIGGTVPREYKLGQNYPNPFNPTTKIEYTIPVSGQVSLKVYNTLGQEVATLYNGIQRAGTYQATFNGSGLASGIYLYQLKAGNVSITKKFILMK
jgi:hypothetical protein